MEKFGASVQYDDWKGTAAADDADRNAIRNILRERGLIEDGDFLIAFELWLGEMHGKEIKRPFLHTLLINADKYETAEQMLSDTPDPLPIKQVDLDFSMDEFLLLFKRFAISMSWKGLDLSGREYIAENIG